MACFRGNREEFYGEVILLDERRLSFSTDSGLKRSSGAGQLLQQVCSHLNLDLDQSQFFGLKIKDDQQQTVWLDPEKTLSQHPELKEPFVFFFAVRFYPEEPHKLEPNVRRQFFLQLQRDVDTGHMPLPPHIKPRLQALRLQGERGDYDEAEWAESELNQEVSTIYKALRGVCRSEAQTLFLSLCCSLPLYGVSLFPVNGQNQSQYFLGPTPGGVVVYKNRTLVGKYAWPRISEIRFKRQTLELGVVGRNGAHSFLFLCSSRSDCKRLWTCCVQHHNFYRLQRGGARPSSLRSLVVTRLSSNKPINHKRVSNKPTNHRAAPLDSDSTAVNQRDAHVNTCHEPAHHRASCSTTEPREQTAPPAVSRCVGGTSSSEGGVTFSRRDGAHSQSSAPWETSAQSRGMFSPMFPVTQRPHSRRSRSLDGEQPIRAHRRRQRRARSHGNSSSESEQSEQRQRRKHGDRTPDSTQRHRRNRTPDAAVWKHIQRELQEPEEPLQRLTEEIPFTAVIASQRPIRMQHSARGRRQRPWASASELQVELVPPLPVTTAADTSCGHRAAL